MSPKTKHALQLTGFAIGTFSVAILSNLTAQHILSEEPTAKKRAVIYASGGVLVSGAMIYYLNKHKFNGGKV